MLWDYYVWRLTESYNKKEVTRISKMKEKTYLGGTAFEVWKRDIVSIGVESYECRRIRFETGLKMRLMDEGIESDKKTAGREVLAF